MEHARTIMLVTLLLHGCQGGEEEPTFGLGGTVSGLDGELVLVTGSQVAVVRADGAFRFEEELVDGAPYGVSVLEQPEGQRCAVARGAGTIAGADVTDVEVACARGAFTLGGTASGLAGGELALWNGADLALLSADGPFTFPRPLPDGTSYEVRVVVAPAGRRCVVAGASGVIAGDDVGDVEVSCDAGAATLAALSIAPGALEPAFDPALTSYVARAGWLTAAITVAATPTDEAATVRVNGVALGTSRVSAPLPLALGANAVVVEVEAPGGEAEAYVLTVVRAAGLTEIEYFKASVPGPDNWFGAKVALSGDTLAVGAPYEDSSTCGVNGPHDDLKAGSGAVYVFRRGADGAWAQEAFLKASNCGADDRFGLALALSGDTLVVGAPFEDSGATGIGGEQANDAAGDAGAVYVFTRAGASWTQQAYVKASNAEAADVFGASVALDGDLLVVGANGEDSAATGVNGSQSSNLEPVSGAAYVFERAGATWSQQAYLKASNTDPGDVFGFAVAVSGERVIVGAPYEDSVATRVGGNQNDDTSTDSGAAYVFARGGGVWAQEAYLKASNTRTGAYFGHAVAVSGNAVAVGAPHEEGAASGINSPDQGGAQPNSGAVYVYRKPSVWGLEAYVKATRSDYDDNFGYSLAFSGSTLVIGAPTESDSSRGVDAVDDDSLFIDAGAAYVLTWNGGAWSERFLKASNTGYTDRFGVSVAVDGQGIAVGANYEESGSPGVGGNGEDDSMPRAGAAYVYR